MSVHAHQRVEEIGTQDVKVKNKQRKFNISREW